MKGLSLYILGGLILMVILQGTLFTSTSLQSQRLQREIADLSQRLDKLQSTTTNDILPSIKKLREELAIYDAKQQGRDQILGITQSGSADLLDFSEALEASYSGKSIYETK